MGKKRELGERVVIGSVLRGRYELTGLLNDGPIFASYSARDRVSGRDVCIRIVKPPFALEAEFLTRLKTVVGRYASIRSQSIEGLTEVDADEESPFLVGEQTRAPSLSDRIRKLAPFSIPVSVATAISICRSLDVLHRAGIVHGDLGSHNIAVMGDGEARLQLSGIWEAYSGSATAGSVVLPSMAPYLAPEVSAGENPSPSSDIYAVGVLLFELLTGRQPYMAETPIATVMRHGSSPTPSVRVLNPSVPAVLDEIVKKAMAKHPGERYANASDLLTDLRLLQDALRFGRTLSWPIRPATTPAGSTAKAAPRAPQAVAPRMSAIRDEEDVESSRSDRDVPMWMVLSLVFLGALAVSLVGVWFLLNLTGPRMVEVPHLRGLTMAEARNIVNERHLRLREADRVPSERVEADKIIEVQPLPGSRVPERSLVTVTVSEGSQKVSVPDLTGRTADKARGILEQVNLVLDPSIDQVEDSTREVGQIVRQSPAAGATVDRNSKVHITTSSGAGGGTPAGNTDAARNIYTLAVKLTDLVEPAHVRIEMTDDNGARDVFDEEAQPGQLIRIEEPGVGTQAVFRIYYDGQLVKTKTAIASGAGGGQ